MAEAKAERDRVTRSEFRHDGEKEKTHKIGYITLYTKYFIVTGPCSYTGYVT